MEKMYTNLKSSTDVLTLLATAEALSKKLYVEFPLTGKESIVVDTRKMGRRGARIKLANGHETFLIEEQVFKIR